MSHRNIEIVIGKLVTDEALRWEFKRRPASALLRLADHGFGLTNSEVDAILGLDMAALERFVATLDVFHLTGTRPGWNHPPCPPSGTSRSPTSARYGPSWTASLSPWTGST